MTTRNVLLLTVDSLRWDHLSGNGYPRPTTPTLDALAENGRSYSQAIANGPSTRSSFPSILTGTYPFMYGGYTYLSEERPFLAETLSDAGFETAAFHSNPYVGAPQNYDQGFDVFEDLAEGSESVGSIVDRVERRVPSDTLVYRVLRRLYHFAKMSTDTAAHAQAETINAEAEEWLSTSWSGDDPFFLWLHYMDVHYPFTPQDGLAERLGVDTPSKRRIAKLNGKMHEDPDALDEADRDDLMALYDAEIRYADEQFGELLEVIDEADVRDETAIVVCADHGEGFGEHGYYGHPPELYDELLRVPLVIDAPRDLPDTTDRQIELVDVAPTVYDLVDVETPDTVQGLSLLEPRDDSRRPAVSGTAGEDVVSRNVSEWRHFACRTPKWKCIWDVHEGTTELFDLEADPREQTDVAAEHSDTVERFRDTLEVRLEEAKATDIDVPTVDRSEEVKQRLRNLGYKE